MSLLIAFNDVWYSVSWDIITQHENAIEHFQKNTCPKQTKSEFKSLIQNSTATVIIVIIRNQFLNNIA